MRDGSCSGALRCPTKSPLQDTNHNHLRTFAVCVDDAVRAQQHKHDAHARQTVCRRLQPLRGSHIDTRAELLPGVWNGPMKTQSRRCKHGCATNSPSATSDSVTLLLSPRCARGAFLGATRCPTLCTHHRCCNHGMRCGTTPAVSVDRHPGSAVCAPACPPSRPLSCGWPT
jgi:hypothetical protein